jgi:glucose/arabinose dehydrogenase
VLRIDPKKRAETTLIRVGQPRGINVAADGMLYLVEAATHRVGHYRSNGRRLADVGPACTDPYDVAASTDGLVYVLDTAASGHVRVVAPRR